jgi:hypothetical protein
VKIPCRTARPVRRPSRGWLTDDELADIATALGAPFRQVTARY